MRGLGRDLAKLGEKLQQLEMAMGEFSLQQVGKLSTNGPPETSQSPCNPLFYDFQLPLHFVNCVPIFWIERSIAGPESADKNMKVMTNKDNEKVVMTKDGIRQALRSMTHFCSTVSSKF